MSKSIYFVFILTLSSALILSTSCKKEGCTDPNATNYSSEADVNDGSCTYFVNDQSMRLEAFINGDSFYAPNFMVTHENGQYNVSGSDNGVGLSLLLPDSISNGNLGPNSANYVVTGGQESANSGSYSYTVSNGIIDGTFAFETNSHSVTAGEFRVEL